MNHIESTVDTAETPEPLVLGRPEQPVAAICDQFFADGGATRAVPGARVAPGGQAELSVGQLLGLVLDTL